MPPEWLLWLFEAPCVTGGDSSADSPLHGGRAGDSLGLLTTGSLLGPQSIRPSLPLEGCVSFIWRRTWQRVLARVILMLALLPSSWGPKKWALVSLSVKWKQIFSSSFMTCCSAGHFNFIVLFGFDTLQSKKNSSLYIGTETEFLKDWQRSHGIDILIQICLG